MKHKECSQATSVDVHKVIERRNDLFALPEAFVRILELAGNEEVGIDLLSGIISKDPALTGRLLKIANSSYYGLNQSVSTIQQAVMVLGLTTVKCLVLSAALFDAGKISDEVGVDIKALYRNIISVAASCQKLAVACDYSAPEEAFTCGLLYKTGLLFYLQNYPREYRNIISRSIKSESLFDEEKAFFGISHPEAGREIAAKWRLPEKFLSAIENHHTFGFKESRKLDDIVRLAVALNLEYSIGPETSIEEKIAKISTISARLGISTQQLDEITVSTSTETLDFAKSLKIDVGNYDSILTRANQEVFKMYMSIQRLFKERQELTRNILDEERQKGVMEAKQVAISTLSHYINNASMVIFGQSQVVRMMLNDKSAEDVVGSLPRALDIIDDSIKKIVAVLEEISDMNVLDDVEYFDQSKVLNIDDRIRERLDKLKDFDPDGSFAVSRPALK